MNELMYPAPASPEEVRKRSMEKLSKSFQEFSDEFEKKVAGHELAVYKGLKNAILMECHNRYHFARHNGAEHELAMGWAFENATEAFMKFLASADPGFVKYIKGEGVV